MSRKARFIMKKKPRLLLVQPTTVHLDGTPHKTRWRLIMGLMIPLMGGLTPDEYDVTLCDERLEDINFDSGWDLVGMTTTIGASLRAYQLGDEFRRRGVPVVFGGFHTAALTSQRQTDPFSRSSEVLDGLLSARSVTGFRSDYNLPDERILRSIT
jgi:hypothetical protein